MIREEEGEPLYRNQKGGKSHIKPMWDSYFSKKQHHDKYIFVQNLFQEEENNLQSFHNIMLVPKFDKDL